MSETQALVSFHIVGDAFVDLMCFLEHGLPMAGGDSLLSRPIETMAGGSAVNTATHLKFLAQNFFELQHVAHHDELRHVWLHTSVNPEDDYGKLLLQQALKHNFPLVNCNRHESECATGHCVVIVSNQERSFMTHPGCMHDLQATDLNLKSLVETPSNIVLHDHHSHIHIAGYYNIPGFWNGKLQDVLERVRMKRTKLPCRTTTTISLVPQHDATSEWDGGLLNLLPLLDFIIMNQVEADSISRRQQQCEAQVDAVGHWASFFALKSPTTWIIVTLGALGAVSLRNGAVVASQAAKRVQVVDPTGAGDAFAAGFLHGLCNWRQQQAASESTRSWPVEAIQQGLYWGCSVASCSVLTRGASVPSPVEKIQEFLNKK